MDFRETDLPGVMIVEPDVFSDARGFFSGEASFIDSPRIRSR